MPLSCHHPATSPEATDASGLPWPIKVHKGARYLVIENEGQKPKHFFWQADTAWELLRRLNREDTILYLETRQRQGFNVIQAVLIHEFEALEEPNRYGHTPLLNKDPGTPNPAYFEHVDWVMEEAAQRGMYLALLPTWGRWVQDTDCQIFNPANAHRYGEWLGRRYRDKPVIWVMGGDRNASAYEAIYRAMAQGIARGVNDAEDYRNLFMTFHPSWKRSSSQWFHNDAWLTMNMGQSGHGTDSSSYSYSLIESDWTKSPAKPTLDGEPRYENHPIQWNPDNGWFDEFDIRQAAYWSIFSGACGHTYGCHDVWQFYNPPVNNPLLRARTNWKTAIEFAGAGQLRYARALIESRDPLSRTPDQSIITAGQRADQEHLRAMRGKGYAYIYAPYGTDFSVRMDCTGGTNDILALWFNPRTGTETPIATYPAQGTQSFSAPSSGRGNDWVLVLEAQ